MPKLVSHAHADARQIQRFGTWLARSCGLLVWGLPLALLVFWLMADSSSLAVSAKLRATDIRQPLQYWQRWAAAGLIGVPIVLLCAGLWQARQCFAGFASGQVFTSQAVRCMRHFAAFIFASVLASLIVVPCLAVLLTLYNPEGQRMVTIALDSFHVFTFFFAAVVWLMAAIIGQGQMLAEDNASIV